MARPITFRLCGRASPIRPYPQSPILSRLIREWTTSGEVKNARADEHIKNLEDEIRAFRKRRPYLVVPKYNPEGWNGTQFVVTVAEDIDPRWSAIVADAVHNLHVALDHLWQRGLYGVGHKSRDHFPAFPI